ncbi:MAG: discoidin domain-containing protein [Deltaproteobacteria bacterium]|uniref:Discoidin domain-containing protein n=1 Tax=Candidatus Zymogenus saltonus TaxID=2844893 RepID=A0A9D8KCK3_9DELT|nr:discoidin domain-containing protein [Candidatus Zymogenus saltonus]
MANVALGKRVEEDWSNSIEATNGNVSKYTGNAGFAYTPWPDNLTIDLENIYELHVIRFLLFDGLGRPNSKTRDTRIYKYRLLTSKDHREWHLHFDTGKDGYNGWQEFEFIPPVQARYVRIHAMWNSANKWFHVVEVEAHDSPAPKMTAECVLKRTIRNSIDSNEIELGETYPLARKVSDLADQIEEIVNKHPDWLKEEPLLEVVKELRIRFRDINLIEQNIDSIRSEIIEPVTNEMDKASKLGKYSKYGFIFGIIGIIVTIIGLVISNYSYLKIINYLKQLSGH